MAKGIHKKPIVDLKAMEEARLAEEAKADKTVEETEKSEPPEEPVIPPTIDWETKFKESQKEAMILSEQIKKAEEEKVKKVEITDEFLKTKHPDWEEMTTAEQKAIRKTEELAQEVQELKNNANKFNNDREWQEKVDTWITEEMSDAFPAIVGREEEFKRFATRPSRKGLPLDDLAKIFLFENPAEPKKRSLFHAPGSAGKPTDNEGMTAEEAEQLMKTKPLEYMRLVRAGKLKVKID